MEEIQGKAKRKYFMLNYSLFGFRVSTMIFPSAFISCCFLHNKEVFCHLKSLLVNFGHRQFTSTIMTATPDWEKYRLCQIRLA